MKQRKKLILAYSGGLDTTFCLKYLQDEHNFEVHTVLVDTGGFTLSERKAIEKKAKELGAHTHTSLMVEQEYYSRFIKYLIFGNVLRNGTYPLSVSSERAIQASTIAVYAKKMQAAYIAHGSTGAGNDQIRFDLMIRVLAPEIEIITPIRDLKLSREAEIRYLEEKGVKLDFKKMAYSFNKGLWGTSIGGKETLTSKFPLPDSAYPKPLKKKGKEKLVIDFKNGEIEKVNGLKFEKKTDAIREIDAVVSPYAIGRNIHVGDTILGIKGRLGFEAGAALVIIKAHQALEKHVLTKWQMYWKEQLANWYGMLLHEAQYLDPVMRDIEKFLESTQLHVSGKVIVSLSPYRFLIDGIESDFDLMSPDFGDYGETNRMWDGDDVKGFTRILGIPAAIYRHVSEKVKSNNPE